MQPSHNIFHYATKELSQDAMIGWLIGWSNLKPTNPIERGLPELGRAFVTALLNTHGVRLTGDIRSTEIHHQNQRIDVLARVEDEKTKHVLLIEDKTTTGPHSDQTQSLLCQGDVENIRARPSDRRIDSPYFSQDGRSVSA